jgi:hypothetical protein
MRPSCGTPSVRVGSPTTWTELRHFLDTSVLAEYGRSGDSSRAAWPSTTLARTALAPRPDPSYHGPIAGPHQLPGKAPRRYTMKARLFTLAIAVAPLAAFIGAAKGRP